MEWRGLFWWRWAIVFQAFATVLTLTAGAREAEVADPFHIAVADTGTRVMIAAVNLSIGKLTLAEGDRPSLVGRYAIDVPMRSSKDETGEMILPLKRPLEEYFTNGGRLTGEGISDLRPGAQRSITCEVKPDEDVSGAGALVIVIDTGDRKMEFTTTYKVVGEVPQKTSSAVAARAAG